MNTIKLDDLNAVTGGAGDPANDPNLKDVIHDAGRACATNGAAGAIIGGVAAAPTGPGALAGAAAGLSAGCAKGVIETGVGAIWDWAT